MKSYLGLWSHLRGCSGLNVAVWRRERVATCETRLWICHSVDGLSVGLSVGYKYELLMVHLERVMKLDDGQMLI